MELLLKQYRNDVFENASFGDICVVNEKKEVIMSYGDISTETIYRSCSKPIQLLPLIINGGIEKFGLSEKELTVMSASHKGEDFHIETIENLMKRTNILESSLYCPEILPGYVRNPALSEVKELFARKIYYNCSGKHVGLMLSSRILGFSEKDYQLVNHPIQKEIVKLIKYFSDFDDEVKIGIDGCGVPVYTVDLKGCAIAYLKLAYPDLIEDDKIREATVKLTTAISHHPTYIGGTNTLDDIVNSDPNLIGKIGAQGLYTVGLKHEKIGICFKMYDGNPANQAFVLANILKRINYSNKVTIDKLLTKRGYNVYNHGKEIVGKREVTF